MMVQALSKRMGESGYFRDDAPRESGSPAPRVSMRPLAPSPPARLDEEGEGEVCPMCRSRADQNAKQCRCREKGDEAEVETGCLTRFGFRRLMEKVEGKLKAAKGKVPGRKGNDFTIQVPVLHSDEGRGSHQPGLYIGDSPALHFRSV